MKLIAAYEVIVSVVRIRKIAIKAGLGKLKAPGEIGNGL